MHVNYTQLPFRKSERKITINNSASKHKSGKSGAMTAKTEQVELHF